MSIQIQAEFVGSEGQTILCCSASGNAGKQQEFRISSPLEDIPGNVRATVRASDGKVTRIDRLILSSESKNNKCWSKLGKLGDPLIVQILLKKQDSGLWRIKKIIVTIEEINISAVNPPRPPRIMCSDEEAGNDMLSCARYGEVEDLKAMLEDNTIPIDFQNESYNTALHYSSANGNVECLDFLLQRGARHMVNSSGNTPLHWAVQNKQTAAVRVLLNCASDVDVLLKNGFGRSALTDAFALDDGAAIAAMLLEHPSAAALEPQGGGGGGGAGGVVEEETEEAVGEDDSPAPAPAAEGVAAAAASPAASGCNGPSGEVGLSSGAMDVDNANGGGGGGDAMEAS